MYYEINRSIVAASGSSFLINYATNLVTQYSEEWGVGMLNDFSMVLTYSFIAANEASVVNVMTLQYYDIGTASWLDSDVTHTNNSAATTTATSLPVIADSGAALPVGTRLRIEITTTARAAGDETITWKFGFFGKSN